MNEHQILIFSKYFSAFFYLFCFPSHQTSEQKYSFALFKLGFRPILGRKKEFCSEARKTRNKLWRLRIGTDRDFGQQTNTGGVKAILLHNDLLCTSRNARVSAKWSLKEELEREILVFGKLRTKKQQSCVIPIEILSKISSALPHFSWLFIASWHP